MTPEQFKKITEWQERVFPNSTAESKLFHLIDEVKELHDAIILGKEDRDLEVADCMFLLFGCAAKCGMTYEHIIEAIDRKFDINSKRTWGNPDSNGVVKHVNQNDSL